MWRWVIFYDRDHSDLFSVYCATSFSKYMSVHVAQVQDYALVVVPTVVVVVVVHSGFVAVFDVTSWKVFRKS